MTANAPPPDDAVARMTEIVAAVVRGHQIASGMAQNNPYPQGSLAMQFPLFWERGLDLSHCYQGTLNLDISPLTFEIVKPDITFQHLAWASGFPPETFSFVACALLHQDEWIGGYIYYPHPETKIGHFQSKSTLEIIAPFIDDLGYGDTVRMRLDDSKIKLLTT